MFQIVPCHLRVIHLQLTVQLVRTISKEEGKIVSSKAVRALVLHHWLILNALLFRIALLPPQVSVFVVVGCWLEGHWGLVK